jgi:hypothetical protein
LNSLTKFKIGKNSKGPIKSVWKENKSPSKESDIDKETIWINRLSDEPNLWLKGTALDAEHEFTKALPLYLKDVTYCLDEGLIVRAALSCYFAAIVWETLAI